MNAWAFGTVVLVVAICAVAWLVERQADRGHELRWHERFYQPQQAHRSGRVIDVPSHPVGSIDGLGPGPDSHRISSSKRWRSTAVH